MPEYIERGGRYFPTPFSTEEKGDYRQGWNHCLRAIYQQATADVKPVVRGKWIDVAPNGWLKGKKYCSHCKGLVRSDIYWMYCPQCGAEMEADNG